MIIKTYDDGRMAEITINSTVKPPISAAELARLMLAHGITAAKIVRTTQTAKEARSPRFVTQQESGQSHSKGGQYGR